MEEIKELRCCISETAHKLYNTVTVGEFSGIVTAKPTDLHRILTTPQPIIRTVYSENVA